VSAPAPPRPAALRSAARARSAAYALFSDLTASPFSESGLTGPPDDLAEALAAVAAGLPYAADFSALAGSAWSVGDFAREYGALFEVGEDGPPVPIREELARPEGWSAKQELVRFYDFFGYPLHPGQQWAPDHLSVELEFMHLLAFREAEARDEDEATTFACAQRDFLERHLSSWVPGRVTSVLAAARCAALRALFADLGAWLERDRAWRRATLPEEKRP
jgi:putative dimethyl sulfoxide reductase chaperone